MGEEFVDSRMNGITSLRFQPRILATTIFQGGKDLRGKITGAR